MFYFVGNLDDLLLHPLKILVGFSNILCLFSVKIGFNQSESFLLVNKILLICQAKYDGRPHSFSIILNCLSLINSCNEILKTLGLLK